MLANGTCITGNPCAMQGVASLLLAALLLAWSPVSGRAQLSTRADRVFWHSELDELLQGAVAAAAVAGSHQHLLGRRALGSSAQPSALQLSELDSLLADLSQQVRRAAKAQSARSPKQLAIEAQLTWPSECPSWLQDYTALHQKSVQNYQGGPSRTRFMMHECSPDTVAGCPGLGDRMRGLMETFKLSVHANRTFLLRWEADAPLEDVLQPALIDWRVQPRYNVDRIADRVRYYWHHPHPKPDAILTGSFAEQPATLMSMTHADQDCRRNLPGPFIGCNDQIPSALRSCVFHALFKPSEKLSSYVTSLRTQLFGASSRPYVAVHLRIGGFEGERKVVRGGLSFGNHSTAEVVANTLRAAQDLAAASNITAPILVLTDNDQLRDRLQRGGLPGFVSPSYKARHAAMVRGSAHREAILTSFADLALMAQAACFIGSPSGFTWTAFMWGRHSCFLMVNGDGQGGLGQLKSGR